MGVACKEHGSEEQCSPANCPQSDRSFVEHDLARPWSTLELGLSSCEEKQLRQTSLQLSWPCCHAFTAAAKTFLPLHCSAFYSWLWSSTPCSVPSNVNSWSSPLTVLSFYFMLFKAKDKMPHVSQDLLCWVWRISGGLTVCLLPAPCSGVLVYVCRPQSDSCSSVGDIHNSWGSQTHLRMQLSLKGCLTRYMDDCLWRNSSNMRFVRFTRCNFKIGLKIKK